MKVFPQDSEVELYKTTFPNDILDRQKTSKQLSVLVERIEDPIVIALDDSWGSGKSYFLKRWVGAHKSENEGTATTIYFDAFAHDYLSDPLVSLITAVADRLPDTKSTKIDKWKGCAKKLVRPAFGIGLNVLTLGVKEQLDEMGDAIADAIRDEVKDATSDLWKVEKGRIEAVGEFKTLLTDMAEEPIVIVVDELDRCRPDYALSVLEVIKHFFAVPKVHFVLGVNSTALENSVKARYGADIDAAAYLKKFINVSFSLPRVVGRDQAALQRYMEHLIEDMDLPQDVSLRCLNLLGYVAAAQEVSLRDVGKICSKLALAPSDVFEKKWPEGRKDIFCVLIVASVVAPPLHKRLVTAQATTAEIRQFIGATDLNTRHETSEGYNCEYDNELTIWFVEILFVCVRERAEINDHVTSMLSGIGNRFDKFGEPVNPHDIPAKIQRDWVDLFRL